MNFTTDLPKKNPLCTYLVAGAAFDRTQLRMHVVAFAKGKHKHLTELDKTLTY